MPLAFFHPRYWPTWLGVGILKLIILLPWHWQMAIGKGLGLLLFKALPARRKISCINIEIAFPEKTARQREELNRQHFVSLGQGLIDAALGWWGSDAKIKKLAHIEGLEYLQTALEKYPVILLGAHFMSLETGARILVQHMPLHAVYRPHQNQLIEYLVAKQRTLKYGKAIPKNNIREMIRSVKSGVPSWYVTDQNYRGKGSVLVPFFGVDAATNPGTSRVAKITGAKVIPCIPVRLNDKNDPRKGYLLRFLPPLSNFPSDDIHQDLIQINHIIEKQIHDFPAQYLWTHKRYKAYHTENKDFYKDYMEKTQDNHC